MPERPDVVAIPGGDDASEAAGVDETAHATASHDVAPEPAKRSPLKLLAQTGPQVRPVIADSSPRLAVANSASDRGVPSTPLTTTERFLRRCDAADVPLAIRVRMHLSDVPDRAGLTEAFAIAVERHPLLRARLLDRLQWQPANAPELRFAEGPPKPPTVSLDGRGTLAATVREIDSPAACDSANRAAAIDIDFHHVATDGQGARQFLLDWFAAYTAIAEGREVKLVRLELERLADRGRIENPASVPPPSLGEGLGNLWTTVRGRSARLPSGETTKAAIRSEHETILTVEETVAVRRAMQTRSVTANDLGIALTLGVCDALLAESGCSRRWITIANPVDLRKPSDRRLPACNRLGFAFVRRRPLPASAANPVARYLPDVAEQMRYVKDSYIGAEFIRGLDLVQPLGLIAPMQSLGWFVPTAQFTCLGDTTRGTRHGFTRDDDGSLRFGSARLEAISGFAPCGPGVPLSIGQCETAARMTFTAVTRGPATSVSGGNARAGGIDGERALALLRHLLDEWVAGD